jgi:glycerol-3-phosphate dehydrogenase
MNRQEIIAQVKENPQVDVLVIGGGVNGIGTFRDLALQGANVLLVERDDFCSGASAASSHMLHGGIRYLEYGEFRLVREALTERNLMLQNAPHNAKPLPTVIPIYKWFSGFFNAPLKFLGLRDKPSERGFAVIKIGLIFYDFFARKHRVMPTHKTYSRVEALKQYPQMDPDIIRVAEYYDAWMPSPERICMEMLTDGEQANSDANALNYVSAVDGGGDTVELRDELTGETFSVQPKIVVNAGGPWIDFVNRAIGEETRFIGGTKGSHLILDNQELHDAANGHEVFFENEDGRITLIFPWMGKVMVGTTDIRIDDPDEARTSEEEIDYILGMINNVFPKIKVDRSQIIFHFSGVRPLPAADKDFTGAISRDHSIRTLEPGSDLKFPVLSLVGGKWTSMRAFSEHTTDAVLDRLGQARRLSTEHVPIGGGRDYPKTEADQKQYIQHLADTYDLTNDRAATLFDRYGTLAEKIAKEGDGAPLRTIPGYSQGEIRYMIAHEKAERVTDLVLRRSLIAWLGLMTGDALLELTDILAEHHGWDSAERQAIIEETVAYLKREHGVDCQPELDTA